MIYATTVKEPTLIVFVTNKDIDDIRKGYTRTVRPTQTDGAAFTGLVVAFAKSDADAAQLLSGYTESALRTDGSYGPGEIACKGCKGSNRPELLFEGQCIVCWAAQAKKLQLESN